MIDKKIETSTILIVDDIESFVKELIPLYHIHDIRIIKNEEKSEFQIAQANQAIKESYISSQETKYIFLCGSIFRLEAQNALLKVLEEPPRNVVFIIITNSKSAIIPTIYSRMPYKFLKKNILKNTLDFDIKYMDLKDIYTFLKEKQKISKTEAKELIELILLKVNSQNLKLDEKQLDLFSKSIKLIELNSRPINVLTLLLLSLLNKKG